MPNMLYSIVTISFNQAKFLERTIISVLNQKNVEFEYIIVDAGSTDGSREIIEKYRNNFSKIIFEKDNGPADGLNKGFSYATGNVFGYLNADDTYESDALKNVSISLQAKKKAAVICGNGFRINKDDIKLKRIITDNFSLIKYELGVYNFIQPSVFIKSDAFKSVGGFNKNNKTCWDAELLVDLGLKGFNISRTEKYLSNFRIHDQSISGTGKVIDEYLKDRDRIRLKILNGTKISSLPMQRTIYRIMNVLETPKKLFTKFNLPK